MASRVNSVPRPFPGRRSNGDSDFVWTDFILWAASGFERLFDRSHLHNSEISDFKSESSTFSSQRSIKEIFREGGFETRDDRYTSSDLPIVPAERVVRKSIREKKYSSTRGF